MFAKHTTFERTITSAVKLTEETAIKFHNNNISNNYNETTRRAVNTKALTILSRTVLTLTKTIIKGIRP